MSTPRIAAFGEIMVRLCPAGKLRFGQVLPGSLEATFGGGEANVCVSLATLGMESRFLTALPGNPIARACLAQLRGLGVDVSRVRLADSGRMGVYYAEHGAAVRGSNVIYDRDHSAIADLPAASYDPAAMLEGCTHLHLTGITPSLSRDAFEATLRLARFADGAGLSISVDLNYRKKLWNWEPGTSKKELAGRCMKEIVSLATIVVGNEEDASDVFGISARGSSVEGGKLDLEGYAEVAATLSGMFPKARFVAITLRESLSADHNNWGAMLFDCAAREAHFAPLDADGRYAPYEIRDIVDRFGGGDSFCAGLIYALNTPDRSNPADAVRFAVAASALKHTIPGDYNLSTLPEVLALMGGNTSGRVRR
ncbi:MAG: PfkB family carbohydrate kinase [Kiritimatiellia bacterium]|jgi:2-dehydro-3-deoxygluconokinase